MKRFVCSLTASILKDGSSNRTSGTQQIYDSNTSSKFIEEISNIASELRKCDNPRAISQGKSIHDYIVKRRLEGDRFISNLLIQMYGKCGSPDRARAVFDNMIRRNTFSWNIMITTYLQQGQLDDALKLFKQMPQPNVISWTAIISGYAQGGQIREALLLFRKMPDRDIVAWNSMISMCVQHRMLKEALQVFHEMPQRNTVSWNAMLSGYVQNDRLDDAFGLFQQMGSRDVVSWNIIITGYAQKGYLDKAMELFKQIPQPDIVSWNAMISGYAQEGNLDEAMCLFSQMPERDLVSWNAIITAYAQQGQLTDVLDVFQQMKLGGVQPDEITFVSILDAWANKAALAEGKNMHVHVVASGCDSNLFVRTALVDMYGKCGCLGDAHAVFDGMPQQNVISWNAILAAYAQHGYLKEMVDIFRRMLHQGVKPSDVTFISILAAYSHGGLTDEGYHCFASVSWDHGAMPVLEHCNCIIDLLGRIGHLDVAETLIGCMPFQPNARTWRVFLGSCTTHNDAQRGRMAAQHVISLDSENAAAYVLLSNVSASINKIEM